ncbi:DUF72 domain-containing protein [Staphylospora marina]|uniref:DUF72 domain-containing protein n=1 Tax=Staphylospora marina TaxID=2490858 RepID=UPI000F5C1E8B|nr:DUF72 domain-containing protein [Staphylospora marina]
MHPVQVGVCGWGDHDLYPPGTPAREKLRLYAGHFPVVEVDSTYHAIAPPERMKRWVDETPEAFRFVVKAYRELTGHGRPRHAPERSWTELVREMTESVKPVVDAGKLSMMLFQFPPWYDCAAKHVKYLRKVREAFADFPLAVEFRNRSWFTADMREKTLRFLEDHAMIHVVCDEPQAGEGSIPVVPAVTHPEHALVRFHGRNVEGWNGSGLPDWRDVRYAWRYSDEELDEWVPRIRELQKQARQVTLLFNNNSQGDAAENAKQMIRKLGLKPVGPAPAQQELFDFMEDGMG